MLDQFPKSITPGLTLKVDLVYADYPAPDWSVVVLLRGPEAIDLISNDQGTGHRVSAAPATTQGWAPGLYTVSVRVSDGADVHEVECGQATVAADMASIEAGADQRIHAQRALDAIEAVLENRASKDQQSYTINNRSLQRTPIADLLKLRDYYRKEVASKSGGKHGKLLRRKINVRLG